MKDSFDRRQFLKVAGASIGAGALFRVAPLLASSGEGRRLSALLGKSNGEAPKPFSFVQFSDTHVGFSGPPNPTGTAAFEKAIALVNGLPERPDLVLFSGDLTHESEKPGEHGQRMRLFKDLAGRLKAPLVRFVPGEHDAGLDGGTLYRNEFGESHYAFDHKGVHFVALDNVSQGRPNLGPEQIAWLEKDLARFPKTAPIVVFTHRPLFDLRPDWEWFTGDGDQAMNLLAPFENVTVLYGHIHRHHDHTEGNVTHHASRSLIFGFPDPASGAPKKPAPFDQGKPFANLGLQIVGESAAGKPRVDDVDMTLREYAGTVGIQQFLKTGDSL